MALLPGVQLVKACEEHLFSRFAQSGSIFTDGGKLNLDTARKETTPYCATMPSSVETSSVVQTNQTDEDCVPSSPKLHAKVQYVCLFCNLLMQVCLFRPTFTWRDLIHSYLQGLLFSPSPARQRLRISPATPPLKAPSSYCASTDGSPRFESNAITNREANTAVSTGSVSTQLEHLRSRCAK